MLLSIGLLTNIFRLCCAYLSRRAFHLHERNGQ